MLKKTENSSSYEHLVLSVQKKVTAFYEPHYELLFNMTRHTFFCIDGISHIINDNETSYSGRLGIPVIDSKPI